MCNPAGPDELLYYSSYTITLIFTAHYVKQAVYKHALTAFTEPLPHDAHQLPGDLIAEVQEWFARTHSLDMGE
jgi:hypothetical protein